MFDEKSLSFEKFHENKPIQEILNAKNCKGAFIIFQGNGVDDFTGTYVVSRGFITDLEPVVEGLTAYFMQSDPAAVCLLPQMMFESFINAFKKQITELAETKSDEDKVKILEFLKEKEPVFEKFNKQISETIFNFSNYISFDRQVTDWVNQHLELVNNLKLSENEKKFITENIEDTYSYALYKSLNETNQDQQDN